MKKPDAVFCILAISAFALMIGCAHVPPVPADKNLLSIVTVGTSREAIVLKLGEPSTTLENGRILAYRIGEDKGEGYFLLDRQVHWANTKYSLVLVFDEKGILIKHTLVQVR